jgi:pimeloyl-ACP methyl ester carboxylesterase
VAGVRAQRRRSTPHAYEEISMLVSKRCRLLFAIGVAFTIVASARADKPAAAPFAVKVVGKGKPMLLIPGLACSGAVWDGTVDHFKDRYECHVLTLAGFAGQPPTEAPFLETVRKGIADYIRAKKLDKPVIVGHSLGGFLVFRLGETEPDLVGPLIAVDGMPFLLAVFNEKEPDAEALKKQAAFIQERMTKTPHADFLKNQQRTLNGWLEGRKELELVTKWGNDSDQATVARAMGELLSQDARPELDRIKTPVLQLAAFNKNYGMTREVLTNRVEGQLVKIPKHELAVADDSRHFIMYDAPEWMWKRMDQFLAGK